MTAPIGDMTIGDWVDGKASVDPGTLFWSGAQTLGTHLHTHARGIAARGHVQLFSLVVSPTSLFLLGFEGGY